MKTSAKKTRSSSSTTSDFPTIGEQIMTDLHRVLETREFESLEDANAFLATLSGNGLTRALRDLPPSTPRKEAQELAFDAMEARTNRQARKLSRQALALDPDCVDAIALLAQLDSRTPEELITALERAVQAGERSLGPQFFTENTGHFWGILETRPYMRARLDLAQLLCAAGRVDDAIQHFESMLELNPNDNQGVRDVLLGCYLSRDNLAGAKKLLHEFRGDGSAAFAWGRVLERFLSGDLPAAKRALRKARQQNRFVEEYLTFQRPLPTDLPESYAMGSEEEAVLCLTHLSGAWADHPLATSWLWEQLGFRPASTPQQQHLF